MKELKANEFRIINFYHNNQLEALQNVLHENAMEIITLDGNSVTDEKSMIKQMAKDLPISSARMLNNNWDQIMDLMWQYVMMNDSDKFALVWKDSHKMLDCGLEALVSMINMFSSFSKQVYSPKTPGAASKIFSIFLLGEGKNYQ